VTWGPFNSPVRGARATSPGPAPPTLDVATVRAYLKVPATALTDPDLTRMLNACTDDQWARCDWDPAGTYPDALAQALLRRIQREVAARNLPLGMVGLDAAEYGPQRLPYLDALVEDHERAYRRAVLA
jgi:hypothetical protein